MAAVLLLYLLVGFVAAQEAPTIEYRIKEELPAHTLIGNIASDAHLDREYKPAVLNQLRYSFLAQSNRDEAYLHIQENTGIIQTAQVIDREEICPEEPSCFLTLDVAVSPREYFKVITIKVEITDLNDNAPKFPQKEMTHHISESTSVGTSIGIPSAEDKDSKSYGIQTYELFPATQEAFSLKATHIVDGSTDLQLLLLKKLDRETQDFYELQVVAQDGGKPPQSGSIIIHIKIDDTNDNHPEFDYESYEIDVFEDTEAGTTIATVIAHDADTGSNGEISYSFTTRTQKGYGKTFGIETTSGAIYLKHPLDYEQDNVYHLVVMASDNGPDSHAAHSTVIVRVMDVNDSPPKITINTLTDTGEAQILESSAIETFVAHVSAVDFDSGPNGQVTCSLNSDKFRLEKMYKDQYKIVTAALFDRELEDSYTVLLECEDSGEMPLRTSEEMRVVVLDANDHIPKFSTPFYSAVVDENNFITSFVVAVSASDLDIGQNGRILFRIDDERAKGMFKLEEHTGVIRAGIEFDHEKDSSISFPVIAYDQGEPPLSSTATVSVLVRDVNDSPPKFSNDAYSFGIKENKRRGTTVGNVAASDADSAPYNKILYSLDADDLAAIESFGIDEKTGEIVSKKPLDREIIPHYYLRVKAVNDDYTPLSSTVSVIVYVNDVNDNDPVMDFPIPYNDTVKISSFVPIGYDVIRIRAHDEDFDVNSDLVYTLSGTNDLFQVDPSTGAVETSGDLSRIGYHQFNMTAIARDRGKPPRSASNILRVIVTDAIPYRTSSHHKSDTPLFSSNSTIVIGVACGSLVVIIVLLCAIIIIKCNDRRQPKPSGTYNCRVEAQKMLNKEQKPSNPDEVDAHHIPAHKEGIYCSNTTTYADMQRKPALSPQAARGKHNKSNGSLERQTSLSQENHSNTNSLRSNKGNNGHPGVRPLHEKEMEVHKVLDYLRRQEDDGDMSTADSGRGTVTGEEPDFNALYNGSYTSFSSNLNEKEALKPQTITIETKKPTPGNGYTSPVPKLSTFAPAPVESHYSPLQPSRTPHPSRNRIIKVEDPCGCHGNSPVIKPPVSSHHDSGYHGNSDSDHLDSPSSVQTVLPGKSASSPKIMEEPESTSPQQDLIRKLNDTSLKDSIV